MRRRKIEGYAPVDRPSRTVKKRRVGRFSGFKWAPTQDLNQVLKADPAEAHNSHRAATRRGCNRNDWVLTMQQHEFAVGSRSRQRQLGPSNSFKTWANEIAAARPSGY